MLDQSRLNWFAELNRGLTDKLDGDGFARRMDAMLAQLDRLALEIVTRATAAYPTLDGTAVLSFVTRNWERQIDAMLFEKAA